jgi:hypothetical protein
VKAAGSRFLVTVRFRTTQPGNAQLRLLRSGRRVSSISLSARAGPARFGPFLVARGGSYALVLVFTDLSGRTKTLRWSTCLGGCAGNPPPSTTGLQLTRGKASVVQRGAVASVTLHFTTSEKVTVLVDVLRNGKPVLKALRFSFAAGPVALGPFAINRSGSYSFRLVATDTHGRHSSLSWIVAIPTG